MASLGVVCLQKALFNVPREFRRIVKFDATVFPPMDQPRISRLLDLLSLLMGNVYYTVDDLARRLGLSRRSIYRYLETLRDAGFDVMKSGDCYRMMPGAHQIGKLKDVISLSKEEALIVDSLLDGLDGHNPLKENLKKKLACQFELDDMARHVSNKLLAVNIHSLSEAVRNKKRTVLKGYRSSNSSKISDREVEPFAFTANYAQIWCFDTADEKNKLFNTARIQSVVIQDQGWMFETKHHKTFMDAFGFTGIERMRVCLRMGTLSRNLLEEEHPLALKDVRAMADGTWILDTLVASYVGVGRFVMGLSADIRILGTPGLVRYIRTYQKEHPI